MATALVFGNSHRGPYLRGHRLAHTRGLVGFDAHGLVFEGERYEPVIQHTPETGFHFHPAIAEDIAKAIEDLRPVCLITAVLGSGHWVQGMSRHPRPFDFLVPDLPRQPLGDGTELIPYDLMWRQVHTDLDWQFGIVRTVRKLCDLPVFHIEAPPPVASAELMLRGIAQHEPTRAAMEKHGVPDVSFRYKIWWLNDRVARHICTGLGLHYVSGPPVTRDAGGFLDPRFYLDGVHGTDGYGELLALEVARMMRDIAPAGV